MGRGIWDLGCESEKRVGGAVAWNLVLLENIWKCLDGRVDA